MLDSEDFMEQFPHHEKYDAEHSNGEWWDEPQTAPSMKPLMKAEGGKISLDDLTGRQPLIDKPREFHANLGDSVRARAQKTAETVKGLGHKYDKGDFVHTAWTEKNGHPPYQIEQRTKNENDFELDGPRYKRDANGQKIPRAPVPAYRVSHTLFRDGEPQTTKYVMEERHITKKANPQEYASGGNVEGGIGGERSGGPVKMAFGGFLQNGPMQRSGMPMGVRPNAIAGGQVVRPQALTPSAGLPGNGVMPQATGRPAMAPAQLQRAPMPFRPRMMADGGEVPTETLAHKALNRIPAQLLGHGLPGGPVGYQPKTTLLQNSALQEHLKNLVLAMQAEHQAEQGGN